MYQQETLNRPYQDRKQKRKEAAIKFAQNHPEERLLHRTKNRAKERGISFDLSLNDIAIPEKCPILGVVLERTNRRGGGPYSPSIDRIQPEFGYVPGNIQIISSKANRMKSDTSPDELLKFAYWITKTHVKTIPN